MTPHWDEALRSLRTADHDIAAFEALIEHPEVHPAMACFHAQQALEKCLKAVLFARQVEFRRTHDLTELSHRLEQTGLAIPVGADWLKSLNSYAVAFRYDDPEPSGLDTIALLEVVRTARTWAGQTVG